MSLWDEETMVMFQGQKAIQRKSLSPFKDTTTALSSEQPAQKIPLLPMAAPSPGFPSGSDDKESACNAGDPGSVPGWDDPLEGESGGSVPEWTETSLDNFLPLKHLLCWSGDHPALPLPMKRLTQAYQIAVF